jgi:hypothetical protein
MTTTEKTNVTSEMAAAVGRELDRKTSYPVSTSDIRRWAIATHYPERPPAPYWDETAAKRIGHGGHVAPLDFNPFAWLAAEPGFVTADIDQNDPNITEKRLGIAGPGLKYQLNGGMSVEYGVRMRPGDVITSIYRLGGYREREGKLGLMLFTEFNDEWTNQRGETVKRFTMTLIRY